MLNTKTGLSALGVNALNPPETVFADRAPTINDYSGYSILTLWFYKTSATPPSYELYFLANKAPISGTAQIATWLKIYPNTSTDNGGNLQTDDGLIAYPDTNANIHTLSGEAYGGNDAYINTYTKNYDANTALFCLKRSLNFPFTNTTATEGMYKLGDRNFLYSYGPRNTILGTDAMNLNISIASCVDNTIVGYNSLASLYDGAGNSAFGSNVMTDLVSGSDNVAIGHSAGDAYDTNESSNIVIGSLGVIGDNNTIRIGIQGTGAAEQNKCFIAGIWNGTYAGAFDTGIVIVNEAGQLYVDNIPNNKVVFTDNNGAVVGKDAAEGYILTAQGIGVQPEFVPLTSSGGSVAISYNAVTHSVNLEATGVAGLSQLATDSGTATPLAGTITIAGGELIETDALTANTVTVNLTRGSDLEVIAGNTGSASTYKGLQSNDGSIIFDIVTYPGKIDMVATGGGGGALTYLSADTGAPATPVLGAVKIAGGLNISTVSATGQVTVNVTDDVSLAGYLYATTDIKTSTGNLEATAGLLKLPYSNGAGTMGQIQFGGNRFLSNYGTNNCFVGELSGNTSLNTGTAISNTYIGYQSGLGTVDAAHCVGLGYNSMRSNQTGSNCTCIGDSSLLQATGSSYMTCLGYRSGVNYTSSADNNVICIGNAGMTGTSNVILLGTQGTGSGQQDKFYAAGIYGATPGIGTAQLVAITTDGKLYSTGSTSGVLSINGSTNINITGTPSIPQVNLNDWILLPSTNAAGTAGGISINSNRFMHAMGTSNTFLGSAAGNLSLNVSVSTENVGIGTNVMTAIDRAHENVGVGFEALKSLTGTNSTCDSDNVAVGFKALTALNSSAPSQAIANTCTGSNSGLATSTGSYNSFYGYGAGSSNTTGSNNLLLGYNCQASSATTSNEIRIGNSSNTAAYLYGVSSGTTALVTVNGANKLSTFPFSTVQGQILMGGFGGTTAWGTLTSSDNTITITPGAGPVIDLKLSGSKVAFHAVQYSTASNITGDGTLYDLGTSAYFTEIYDYSSSFYPGNGSGTKALFTAPKTGLYQFIVTVLATNLPSGATTRVDPINIVTSNRTYSLINPVINYTTTSATQTVTFTAIADMNAASISAPADTAYFQFGLHTSLGTKTVGIGSTYTTISGFFIA